jgi:type II secretion system protein H
MATEMMRTLRAGNQAIASRVTGQGGYSLLELLVVVAILSVMVVIMIGYVPGRRHAHDLKLEAYGLEMDLRTARSRAIYGGQVVGFTVDLAQNAWRYADQPAHKVSKGMHLSIYTGRQLLSGESAGTIEFFPNGQSGGGHITLEAEGSRSEVDIDWLTGRIHPRDPDDQS